MKRPLLLAAVAVFAGLSLLRPPAHARVVRHVEVQNTWTGNRFGTKCRAAAQ